MTTRLTQASLLLLASLACVSRASAEDPGAPYLFGDWGGERSKLAAEGVTFTLTHTFDIYDNVAGGDRDTFIYFGRQRISADLDLEKLTGWKGAELFITTVHQYGRNYGKRDIGLYTNPSGIEGQHTTRLAEIWLGQKLWDDKLQLKIGKLDGVAEFGLQDYGSTFMNDELNYVPNAIFASGMPFDPAGKPGIVAVLQPFTGGRLAGLYVKGGVFAANDNNAYAHDENGMSFASRGPTVYGAEIGYKKSEHDDGLPGIYKLGMHYNAGGFTDLVNPAVTHSDNTLVYLNANQTVFFIDAERKRHVDAAFTVAASPGNRNSNNLEFTALVRVIGPFASRPMDEAGIGFISSHFSDEASDASVLAGGAPLGREQTIELTYKAKIRPWFTLQPDVQLVFDPSGDSGRGNVLILGLRTVVDF